MKHATQWPTLESFDQHMNMIGHHTPRQQSVSLPVEMEQGIFHQSSDAWLPKQTFAMTRIQVILNPTAQFGRGLRTGSAVVPPASCVSAFSAISKVQPKFLTPLLQDVLWHGIGKPEIERLDHARVVPMRHITARVPAKMWVWRFRARDHPGSLLRSQRKTRRKRWGRLAGVIRAVHKLNRKLQMRSPQAPHLPWERQRPAGEL